MRVLIAVFALVATPFIASVAQERGGSGHRGSGDVHAVRQAGVKAPKGQKAQHDDGANCEGDGNYQGANEGCGDPPPPTPILPPVATKFAEIHGLVWHDVAASGIATPSAGIANWLLMLNGAAAQTTLTDATGNYAFVGLSAGTYNVCETTRFAWIQTYPTSGGSCAGGFGYTISLAAGQVVTGINFGNWN
jgi:hypothetical protein